MVGPTQVPLNFCWFPPHLQFPVVFFELQYATNGSPIVLPLFPTSRLKKTLWISFPTFMPGLIFKIAWMSIVMKLFSRVLFTIMNLVNWLTICQWNCVSLVFPIYRPINNSQTLPMTAHVPAPKSSSLLPPSFTRLTDVEDFITQFEAVASFSDWSTLNPDPPAPFLFCPPHWWCSYFLPVLKTCSKWLLRRIEAPFPASIPT